jgi:hypothetical protein
MLKLGCREFVALLLSLLIATPPRIAGAANGPAARTALGSIESSGTVRIGEVLTPSQNTLFAGDRVRTNNGGAVIQYRQGSRVVLASETVADFAPARVQLEKGLMTFESPSNSGMIFAASTLRLEPSAAKTAANVTFTDSKASISVTQGTLKIVDPSGLQLASLNAGEARMFEEAPARSEPASASSPSPSSAAAPPQGGGGSNRWILALGVGVVGLSLGIAGIVRANDANSRADSATAAATAATAQATALQAQVTAANAAAALLQTRLNATGADAAVIARISADLAAQIARLAQAQASLSTIVAQLAAGQITPAAAATQLAALQTIIAQATQAIAADGARAASCAQAVASGVTSTACA